MKNDKLNNMWKLIESKTVAFSITPDFIKNFYENYSRKNYGTEDNLYSVVGSLYYYLDKDEQFVINYLNKLSEIGTKIIELFLNKYGLYVNQSEMRVRLLESIDDEFKVGYPIPIYVSGSPEDKMTIGLAYHEDSRIEMFEGNDEASEDTIKKINRVLGGKKIRIYGSHNQQTVNHIIATRMLPQNIYVSPEKDYASGYFGEDRVLFSGIVDSSYLNQESEYDWKTMEETPIEKIRYV